MRRVALMVLLSIATAAAADKDKGKFAPSAASSYPGHQTFEKITIAAVPFDTPERAATAFGKVNPYKYGILPVLVILQNDTGKALRLDVTAQFIDWQNRHLEAMPPSDVVLFDGSPRQTWKVPGPSPLPIPRKPKKGPLNTWEIEGRAFTVHLLPAGESVHGFFYFETENRPGSKLYLTGIRDAASGQDYLYFEVPFQD